MSWHRIAMVGHGLCAMAIKRSALVWFGLVSFWSFSFAIVDFHLEQFRIKCERDRNVKKSNADANVRERGRNNDVVHARKSYIKFINFCFSWCGTKQID